MLDAILCEYEVPRMDKEELKEATKEALKEWLDSRYATFGRWSIGALGAAGLAALVYLIMWSNGWHK